MTSIKDLPQTKCSVRERSDGVKQRYWVGRSLNKPNPRWEGKKGDEHKSYYQLAFAEEKYPQSPFGDADIDEAINILDKEPLNKEVKSLVPPCVKNGNTKLASNIGVFSLPRYFTCPGKTEFCERYCYAEGPERFRPSVVYSRNKNLTWSMQPDFVDTIDKIIKRKKLPYFRIHEAGDFYDQKYFDKWAEIAKKNPQTKFLAFTKNWNLDYKKKPENLTIRYSTDLSSKHLRKDLPQCAVSLTPPKDYFKCKGKCLPGFCMECWKDTNVYIPLHSISKKAREEMGK